MCQPASEQWSEKLFLSAPTIAISLMALAVSVCNFWYTRSKDQRSRRQSIDDDFWLRKVVSPMSIEPFLKYVIEMAIELPDVRGSTTQDVRDYWKKNVHRLGEFEVSFGTLALIDETLNSAVAEDLEKIGDLIASYCGSLGQHLDGTLPKAPDRDDIKAAISALAISILKRIKAHQVAVGHQIF